MLAFAKDITQARPVHPGEAHDAELHQYMDYQRSLNHVELVTHALERAKADLESNHKALKGQRERLVAYVKDAFPLSSHFAKADTLEEMLGRLIQAHKSQTYWYRMNPYYYALLYDCLKQFVDFYNRLTPDEPEARHKQFICESHAIDLDDWVFLFFPDLDFHIGRELAARQYPFARRNRAIEEGIEERVNRGGTRKQALRELQSEYEMEDASLDILLGTPITRRHLELPYTEIENPIYEFLTEKREGSWEALEGESIMDQTYSLGSNLKVWVWKKKTTRGSW